MTGRACEGGGGKEPKQVAAALNVPSTLCTRAHGECHSEREHQQEETRSDASKGGAGEWAKTGLWTSLDLNLRRCSRGFFVLPALPFSFPRVPQGAALQTGALTRGPQEPALPWTTAAEKRPCDGQFYASTRLGHGGHRCLVTPYSVRVLG